LGGSVSGQLERRDHQTYLTTFSDLFFFVNIVVQLFFFQSFIVQQSQSMEMESELYFFVDNSIFFE
jgi:hypothetical protein